MISVHFSSKDGFQLDFLLNEFNNYYICDRLSLDMHFCYCDVLGCQYKLYEGAGGIIPNKVHWATVVEISADGKEVWFE